MCFGFNIFFVIVVIILLLWVVFLKHLEPIDNYQMDSINQSFECQPVAGKRYSMFRLLLSAWLLSQTK